LQFDAEQIEGALRIWVGLASSAIASAQRHLTVLRVSVARSASKVRKLWTGRPASVRLVLALRFAAGEGWALATGEERKASVLSRQCRLDLRCRAQPIERGVDFLGVDRA
jgi:hypothetical protein